jgi:hypothetical protein
MRRIEAGDLLIVTRLDRLARSTRDLLNILHQLAEKGARRRIVWNAVHLRCIISLYASFCSSVTLKRAAHHRDAKCMEGTSRNRPRY